MSSGRSNTPSRASRRADPHRRTRAGEPAPSGRSSSCAPRSAARSRDRARAAVRTRPVVRGHRPASRRTPSASRLGLAHEPRRSAPTAGSGRLVQAPRRRRRGPSTAPRPTTPGRGRRIPGRGGRACVRKASSSATKAGPPGSAAMASISGSGEDADGRGELRRQQPQASVSRPSRVRRPRARRSRPGPAGRLARRSVREDGLVEVGEVVEDLVRARDRVEVDPPRTFRPLPGCLPCFGELLGARGVDGEVGDPRVERPQLRHGPPPVGRRERDVFTPLEDVFVTEAVCPIGEVQIAVDRANTDLDRQVAAAGSGRRSPGRRRGRSPGRAARGTTAYACRRAPTSGRRRRRQATSRGNRGARELRVVRRRSNRAFGPQAVIGRAWRRYQRSRAKAASMSTGASKASSTRMQSWTRESRTESARTGPVAGSTVCVRPVVGRDQPLAFVARRERHDVACDLVHDDLVGRRESRDHRLAETADCVDEELVGSSGHRMTRENDDGGIGRDDGLDHDSHRGIVEPVTASLPIRQGSRTPERRPTALHGRRDAVGRHAEFCCMQPRVRGVLTVFADRRRTDGERVARRRPPAGPRPSRAPRQPVRATERRSTAVTSTTRAASSGSRTSASRIGPVSEIAPRWASNAAVVRANPGGTSNPSRASRSRDAALPPMVLASPRPEPNHSMSSVPVPAAACGIDPILAAASERPETVAPVYPRDLARSRSMVAERT